MKKILIASAMILLSISVNAEDIINTDLNLYNPDVRKCLLEATKESGWELKSVYTNDKDQLVMVFDKGDTTKIYKSK
ncbi:hypothetical protein [Jejuia pallidilutea]|jgi:hypothetical protein|uniref:Uncharacterized protein n=1 Tax=Jejuia pallidilutea TaxID=504487 RepID=A0A090VLJ3_9FLAO|nr:hypothetical protein [Jejuia pallidilutea]GAL65576.1 hypothetical protein JCM19301_4036 [Jejuia pallidilutea]GAL70139.1 hypothetical protein JCM19302_2714 [Jejuia pallidilutea]GAL88886.1 hypothetical protein JCM19538_1875 [Jejuia pallidilutea]